MDIDYLRSFRVSEIAMFDLVMSYIGLAIIIQIFGLEHSTRNYLLVLPISIIAHLLIGQKTTMTTMLFNNELNVFKIYFVFVLCMVWYLTNSKFNLR